MSTSPFAFALCQPGTERWLKAEVARLRPDLHAGFARPGLVTFKATGAPFTPEDAPPTVFGRAWGCSGGSFAEAWQVRALASKVGAKHAWVGARDAGVPDEVPPARQAAFDAAAEAWRVAVDLPNDPRPGDIVLDVIVAPDEPALVGWHRHGPERHPGPAGRLAYEVPADVPSRAFRKVVEGLAWSRAPVRAGETVLEIGAAPGGGTRAFVERGLNVVAVDPTPMDPAVLALPGVTWIPRFVGDVNPVPPAEWLACDADIPPAHVLGALTRLVPQLPKLRGLLWTVKLVDGGVAAGLPKLFEQLRKLGATEVRGVQLAANKRDVFVYARWGKPSGPAVAKRAPVRPAAGSRRR